MKLFLISHNMALFVRILSMRSDMNWGETKSCNWIVELSVPILAREDRVVPKIFREFCNKIKLTFALR